MLLPNENSQLAIKLDDENRLYLTTRRKPTSNSVILQNEARLYFLMINFFGEVTIQFPLSIRAFRKAYLVRIELIIF
jgi:hypothetical protein